MRSELTIDVKTKILPHLPSDDLAHAEECVHLEFSFPGSKSAGSDTWLCLPECPLRCSLELAGASYRSADEEVAYWYDRLIEGRYGD